MAAGLAMLAPAAAGSGEAHEHGRVTLNVAFDGSDLVVELAAPAVDVVGFEYAPSNDAERRAVADALARFGRAAPLLTPTPAAGCEAGAAEARIGETAVADGHDRAHADKHDGHASEGGEAHAELVAVYRFHCESPQRLENLEVNLFERLLDTRAIEVRVAAPGFQTRRVLARGERRVPLAP